MPMLRIGFGNEVRWWKEGARSLFVVLVVLGIFVLCFSPCFAQRNSPQEGSSGIFLPSNRLDSRGIERAKQRIAEGEYSQAIRFLDEVLAREEDSFVTGSSPASREDELSGLKGMAHQILKTLPPEGRRFYETTFGPVARRELRQVVKSGNLEQLRKVTQRYFYTPAGYEAALLFAQHEADQGRHLTAALTYQQLLETEEAAKRFEPQLSVLAAMSWLAVGNRSQGSSLLKSLAEQGFAEQGTLDIRLSDQNTPLRSSEDDLVEWLLQAAGTPVNKNSVAEHQWLTTRGNSARNGHAQGGLPHLRARWRVRLLEHHALEEVHEEMAGVFMRQERPRLPAATPLAVGDYVITRSAHGLVAIDFKTGKRIWQAESQQESLLQDLMDASDQQNGHENNFEPAQAFVRMIWEDYLYNTTSSDGQRVYVIRDLALPRFANARHQVMPSRSAGNDATDTNRLCAYDLSTQGKLVWEIDGAARRDLLQGAFFLGAPVTVGQSLYCLAEIKSETAIYLVALNRQTGELQWRQQLADLEAGINLDLRRRLQASMPSYDEGMLICPTGSGVVIGVDLAKQALAWAYRYQPEGVRSFRTLMLEAQAMVTNKQWVHSSPIIADGRVLLTPPESGMLHCLDLVTGKLLWKQPRGDAIFLAGVEQGRVLLVGNRRLSALRLADGEPAWSAGSLELPAGSVPTGSGFFSKGKYFLPLSNAQVIAVDASLGKLVAQTHSRDGQLLGNLICYQGTVISQTGQFLDCFEQVEVLRKKSERRRAKDPTDFESLRTLGEIAYNEGQLSQAIDWLSQAYESEPADLRTQEVLSEALVAALDEDFAEHQKRLPLLAQIQQESTEAQLTLLRLQSQGLLELGRSVEAFEICLQAFERLFNENTASSLEIKLSVGRDHQVNAQRWLAAQVALVWEAASLDERERISELVAPLLTQVRQVADTNRWQQFYDCLGTLELTEPLGVELVTHYFEVGNLLAAQQLLLKLTESENAKIRNAAIASCSRLLHKAERATLAQSFDKMLRGDLANQVCLSGKSGKECLAEWASSGDSNQLGLQDWPYGRVEWSLQKSSAALTSLRQKRNRSPLSGIPLERSDSVLGNCNLTLLGGSSGQSREILIHDSLGHEFFKAQLDQGVQAMMNAQNRISAVSRGTLLILAFGREIVAFDTLSKEGKDLWRKNTTSKLHHLNQLGLSQLGWNQRNGILRARFGQPTSGRSANAFKTGVPGPVTHNSCVFQIEDRLVCVDPLSGKTQWSRSDLPLDCDLYGDEKYVFAVPKGEKRTLVYNTTDGRVLGETSHRLPAMQERLATVGRQVIRWRKRADRRWELSSIDSLHGKVLWKYEFEKNARVDVSQNRFVAVAESTGKCVIVDLQAGRVVVDQPIVANVALREVHLLAGTESFVLAVQQQPKVDLKRHVRGLNNNKSDFTSTAFAGQVYLFDRSTGQARWQRPAEVQGLPLMLAQSVDLPVIAFAGNIRRRDKHGSKQEIGMMLLEKSSGRMLFHDETLPQSANYFFVRTSYTDTKEVVVEMLERQLRLKFTDLPRAPEPPATHEVQRKTGSSSHGLQKIGEKFLH